MTNRNETICRARKLERATAMTVELLEDRRLFAVGAAFDPEFGEDGSGKVTADVIGGYVDVAGQGDGKILALGADDTVTRYNADGSIDMSFGGGDGRVTLPIDARKISVVSGNRVLVIGGVSGDASTMAIARLTATGGPDTTFGGGDGVATYIGHGGADRTGSASDLVLIGGGKMLISGLTASGAPYVARFNADGSPDNAFGSDSATSATTTLDSLSASASIPMTAPSISVAGNGSLFLASSFFVAEVQDPFFSNVPDDFDLALFSLSSAGAVNNSFGGGDGYVTTKIFDDHPFWTDSEDKLADLSILPNGNVLALLNVRTYDDSNIVVNAEYVLTRYAAGTGSLLQLDNTGDFGHAESGNFTRGNEMFVRGNRLFVVGTAKQFNFDAMAFPTSFVSGYKVGSTGEIVRDEAFGPGEDFPFVQVSHVMFAATPFHRNSANTYRAIVVDSKNRIVAVGGAEGNVGPDSTDVVQTNVATVARFVFADHYIDENSQAERAASLSVDEPVNDVLDTVSDIDMFSVFVEAGTTLEFDVDGSPLDAYLRLFDIEGRQLAASDNTAAPGEPVGKSPYVRYTFAQGGQYFIGLSVTGNEVYSMDDGAFAVPGTGPAGAYTLHVRAATPYLPDTNDRLSTATPRALNTTQLNVNIADPTDVDIYKFTVTAGQRISFDVDAAFGPLDSYLRLFNASGTELAANDNAAAPGESLAASAYLAYTFASAGTYYIAVSAKGNDSYDPLTGLDDTHGANTGPYTLTLSVL
jgi:uncharacterized delta-60 repeat protein